MLLFVIYYLHLQRRTLQYSSNLSKKKQQKKLTSFCKEIFQLYLTCFRACLLGGGGPQVGEVTRLAVVEEKKKRLHTILQPRGAEVRFLEVVVALEIKEFEQRRPKLTSRERRKINSRTHMYLFMKASRVVLRGVWFREKPLT